MRGTLWLKGHRESIVPLGARADNRRTPSGGWDSACVCGWRGSNWTHASMARDEYRGHVNNILSHGLFKCCRCGVEKPLEEMRKDYRYMCIVCFSKSGNDWARRNPTESVGHKRKYHLMKKFGITIQEFRDLLVKQNGGCAICESPIFEEDSSAHIDHDHSHGAVRGLLCFNCNVGLGSFKDNVEALASAIFYLRGY